MSKFVSLLLLCLAAGLVLVGFAQAQDKTFTNSIGVEFVLIPAGSFIRRIDFAYEEKPEYDELTIGRPFYLGKHEVTQRQWSAVMGNNPSKFKGQDNPVENVSWDDVELFIKRLNEKEGHNRYRLPTDAEWEYAARAGTAGVYFFGDDGNELSRYGWHEGNSGPTTRPVGQKPPNPWGLHDVHGNVWEWVEDRCLENHNAGVPGTEPGEPARRCPAADRFSLGGSWFNSARDCRFTSWYYYSPLDFFGSIGFRLALSPGQ